MIDKELVLAIYKDLVFGGQTLDELDIKADDLRPESEMGPVKGALSKALKVTGALGCMAPVRPKCHCAPIKSHSMQRGGALKHLVNSTGHVMMMRAPLSFQERPKVKAKLVGQFEASVFPGLCQEHDAQIFSPIDKDDLQKPNGEQLFLLSYRSFLKEVQTLYWKQMSQMHSARSLAAMPNNSSHVNLAAQVQAYESHLRFGQFYSLKKLFDVAYIQQDFDKCFDEFVTLIPRTSFTVSSVFEPSHDMNGAEIKSIRGQIRPLVFLNVVPCDVGSLVVVATLKPHAEALKNFLQPFKDAGPTTLNELLWECALRNCENLAFAPDAWDKLTPEQQVANEVFFEKTLFGWAPKCASIKAP